MPNTFFSSRLLQVLTRSIPSHHDGQYVGHYLLKLNYSIPSIFYIEHSLSYKTNLHVPYIMSLFLFPSTIGAKIIHYHMLFYRLFCCRKCVYLDGCEPEYFISKKCVHDLDYKGFRTWAQYQTHCWDLTTSCTTLNYVYDTRVLQCE